MALYIYKAKDVKGKDVVGTVEASDQKSASAVVKAKGLYLYRLSENRQNSLSLLLKMLRKPGLEEVSTLTRQLATMINAGLPITEALTMLKDQGSPAIREIVSGVLRDIQGGMPLSKSLARYPGTFSSVYVAIVNAGESAGVLDQLLARLADNLEGQREFKAKIKGAMIYPIIITIGMVAVMFIMMIFVIPKLTSLYTEFDAELPGPTKVVMGISSLAAKFWWLGILLVFGLINVYRAVFKIPLARRKIEKVKLGLPIIGKLTMSVMLAEMTRTLGLLLSAGVSMLEALTTASQVGGSKYVEDFFQVINKKVEKGYPLASAFAEAGIFPRLMVSMLAVGEETGKLDEVLMKVSHNFQVESEESLKGLTAAIEPLIMIMLGVGVGFLVIAVILPIYNLSSQF